VIVLKAMRNRRLDVFHSLTEAPKLGASVCKQPGYGYMNALLEKALSAIKLLPEAEQEAIALELLARVEADARWDALFADPRSEEVLRRLAAEAEADIERGDVLDCDPAGGCRP
jgi:hypothetical protein